MNYWSVTVINRHGETIMSEQGQLDPFKELIKNNGASTVRCGTTRWVNLDGGGVTVKFEVGLSCDQSEEFILKAGELALGMAIQMTTKGLDLILPNGKMPP